MSLKFVKAQNVYDHNGYFLGRLEHADKENDNGALLFVANEDAMFTSEEIKEISDLLSYRGDNL